MSYQQFKPSSFKLLPDVVKNLLIINFLLFLADYVFASKLGFSLNYKYGLYYVGSERFMPIQIVTHLFLHGGFWHIFSNMFALWMFGNILENVWGSKRFLIYYFTCGIGAALIHMLTTSWEMHHMQEAVQAYAQHPNIKDFTALVTQYNVGGDLLMQLGNFLSRWQMEPDSSYLANQSVEAAYQVLQYKANIPTVGASGAVFGVLLAFGMLFPNTLIYLWLFFPVKAKYFVIFYGLFELYAGFQNNPGDNIAHFAHLGGMLFGFILIRIWNKRRRNDFY
jgi:membrane associated rhomboid family serine protease